MSKIKVHILGTTAGIPTRERSHSALYVTYDDGIEFPFLFDCGEGTQLQLLKAGLNMMKLDNVFITHWHGDHCLGLPGMIDTMGFEGRDNPLNIYAPESGRVKKLLDFSYSIGKFKLVPHNVPSKGTKIIDLLEEDRFKIVSSPAKHSIPAVSYALVEKDKTVIDMNKALSAGMPEKGEIYKELKEKGKVIIDGKTISLDEVTIVKKGKKIVYSGDTEICDNLRNLVKDADLIIQDCTYFTEQGPDKRYQHATLPEIIKMVEEGNVKKVILTHISRKYQDIEELRSIIDNYDYFEVAEDLMVVEV